jgi:alpha-ketoglutarate-dependent taurine dioxygenase
MLVAEKSKLVRTDLSPRIGTEFEADIDTLVGGEVGAQIRAILEERGVVVFRELNLSDEQQEAFTATLGPVAEKIFKISMDKNEQPLFEYTKGAFFWHIDGTMSQVPIFASIMSGRRISPIGGQTEFANTYAAYDDLPEAEKEALGEIRVAHMFEASQRMVNPEPSYATVQDWQRFGPNVLPLVWTHRSGRKSLVLGATASHVVGMDPQESFALLARLREHATQPQFVYRHEWSVGDLVIWDNTGTMHRALAYPHDSGRLMHRTTIRGDEPFA